MDFTRFENFKNYFTTRGLPDVYAVVLYAQAIHETGRFTSNVYRNANNAYGMKVAKVRPQNRVGSFGAYALYASVEDSILDRIAWDAYNSISPVDNINDIQEYMRTVIPRYAEDPDYFQKWFTYVREVLNQFRDSVDSVPNDELETYLVEGDHNSSGFNFFGGCSLCKKLSPILLLVLGFVGWKIYKKYKP